MSETVRQQFHPTQDFDTSREHSSSKLFSELGMLSKRRPNLIKNIETGFSIDAVDKLVDELEVTQSELLGITSIRPATFTRRRYSRKLNSLESDRIYRIAQVYRLAVQLFEGNKNNARKWLKEPAKALGGESPLNHLKTEAGADEVQQLIERLEHGVIT